MICRTQRYLRCVLFSIKLCKKILTSGVEHVTIVTPTIYSGDDNMRFKEHILNIVRDEHPICNGVEYKRLNAQMQDSITAFMEGLTPAQRVMLDQTILQGFDVILKLQYEWVCYKTFDEVTKAWRTLVIDSDYTSSLEELIE